MPCEFFDALVRAPLRTERAGSPDRVIRAGSDDDNLPMAPDEGRPPPAVMTDLRDRLERTGTTDLLPTLAPLLRPGLVLQPELEHPNPEEAPVRVGGRPHLPAEVEWPRDPVAGPLSFIAEIDLAEAATLLPDAPFPARGTLSFFYEAVRQEAWGFVGDEWAWRVIHHEDRGLLRDPPDDVETMGGFTPIALTPHPQIQVTTPINAPLPIPEAAWATMGWNQGVPGEFGGHRFLGVPEQLQGDMRTECQLSANGVEESGSPDGAALLGDSDQWRLLLQIDSDENAGMNWGDAGLIYWWIRESDLAAGAWDRTWFMLQCM